MTETNSKTKRPSGISGKKEKIPPKEWPGRITLFAKDEQGNLYGVISITKQSILDVFYSAVQHQIILTMKSTAGRWYTQVSPVRNQAVEKNQIVNKDGYTTREMLSGDFTNNTITVTEELEMKKVWEWLGHEEDEMSWDSILEIRKTIEKKIEEAKADAKKRAEEAEEAINKERPSGIVNTDGEPIKSGGNGLKKVE